MATSNADSAVSAQSTQQEAPPATVAGPFAGAWESCDGAVSPDECSRYLLIQHGDRICGTWSYFATGKGYEGRLGARAISETKAQRTQVCGRPGSEADTECAAGWQKIDKPLQLCDGKLSDMAGADGPCFADYKRVPVPQDELSALEAEPWLKACLTAEQ
ncbi:hypothetical protein [Stenotrophomonas humi]